VLEVRTAEEALFLSNGYEHPIHLLRTDIVLSARPGTKLAEELLSKRPALKVLLISGHVNQSHVGHASLTSQLPFIQKPFTNEVLLAKVREVLDV